MKSALPSHRAALALALALALSLTSAVAGAQRAPSAPPAKNDAIDACLKAAESGQTLKRERKLLQARQTLLECLRPTCPRMVVKDCDVWKRDVDQSIPSIIVRVLNGAEALARVNVLIDGERITTELRGQTLDLDPGQHRVQVTLDDGRASEQTLVIEEGVRHRVVEFQLQRPVDVPRPAPPATGGSIAGPLILGGVGAASLIAFTALALSADSDYAALEARCGSACDKKEVDGLKSRYLVADVFLVAGVASLVGAGVWWMLSGSSPQKTSAR